MCNQKAFTLLEILITFVLFFILLMISLPSLNQMLQNNSAQILQSQLKCAIQLAQHEVLVHGVTIAMCGSQSHTNCDGNWLAGQIVFENENQDGKIDDKNKIITIFQKHLFSGQLYFRSFPYYRHHLLFFSQGWNDNGTFWYCHSKRDAPLWALLLSKSGRVRIVYPDHQKINDAQGKLLKCN